MEGTRIHLLKGTGSNCTCGDCAVLYGGTCYTTPINNFLDRIDAAALKVVGQKTYICISDLHRFLEKVRQPVKKRYKLTNDQYDERYYSWAPLFYMALGYREDRNKRYDWHEARRAYRRARGWVLSDIEKALKQK